MGELALVLGAFAGAAHKLAADLDFEPLGVPVGVRRRESKLLGSERSGIKRLSLKRSNLKLLSDGE